MSENDADQAVNHDESKTNDEQSANDDGDAVVTLGELIAEEDRLIAEEQQLIADANAVLGAADDTVCTYPEVCMCPSVVVFIGHFQGLQNASANLCLCYVSNCWQRECIGCDMSRMQYSLS